jgi:hypothetical protein
MGLKMFRSGQQRRAVKLNLSTVNSVGVGQQEYKTKEGTTHSFGRQGEPQTSVQKSRMHTKQLIRPSLDIFQRVGSLKLAEALVISSDSDWNMS